MICILSSSTRTTRLASLMLVEAPQENFLAATDTIAIIHTDILHVSALFSRKLPYFSLCTDRETHRLLGLCQIQTGYTLQHFVLGNYLIFPFALDTETHRLPSLCQILTASALCSRPTNLNALLPGQIPEFYIYRKLHDWC